MFAITYNYLVILSIFCDPYDENCRGKGNSTISSKV